MTDINKKNIFFNNTNIFYQLFALGLLFGILFILGPYAIWSIPFFLVAVVGLLGMIKQHYSKKYNNKADVSN